MAELPPHLQVKESLIPGAGMGLFARRKIKKNERIGRYKGPIYTRKAARSIPKENQIYKMATLGNCVVDGSRMDNHMRWLNHSLDPNAAAIVYDDRIIWIKALKSIEPGEEIYIKYSDNYKPPKST
jgi:SET domain-containing protein